jgi:small subunit ribosomal protein S1
MDDSVDVMILSVDPEAEKIALGIKQTQPNPWKQLAERYPVGSNVKGTVRNLTDYGAFVQIEEGIDGLLHVSDISWTKKITHPSEELEKGQELEVKILSIDPESEKISVGLKQLEEDPWQAVINKLPMGAHVEVEIAKLVSFGAFARLENGIEGLIHVSELGDKVQKPEEVLSIGDKVMAKVISVGQSDRKIGLSMREYQRDLEKGAMAEHQQGNEARENKPVDVQAAMQGAVPPHMIQAGKSLADVAHEMMAAVNAAEEARRTAANTQAAAGENAQTGAVAAGANEEDQAAVEATPGGAPEGVVAEPAEETAPKSDS